MSGSIFDGLEPDPPFDPRGAFEQGTPAESAPATGWSATSEYEAPAEERAEEARCKGAHRWIWPPKTRGMLDCADCPRVFLLADEEQLHRRSAIHAVAKQQGIDPREVVRRLYARTDQ